MRPNAPDIFSPEYAADPYPFYKVLRDHYPFYFHEGAQSYVLSRYEDVVEILRSPAASTESYAAQLEPVYGYTILQMDGREHARHRNLLNPAFRGADLRERFIGVIQRNVRALIDGFRHRGQVDLVTEFAALLPIHVIVDMLGLPKDDVRLFSKWYTAAIAFFGNFARDPEVTKAAHAAKREVREYMAPVLAERRANPGPDLLSTLCNAEVDGLRLNDEQLSSFVTLLLTAGGETTDKAIALAVKNLLEHPEQLRKVREDRSLIERAMAETLRYTTPGHLISRLTLEDVKVSHGTIPARSTVLLLLGAANRDERRFADPDRFDIFRHDLNPEHAFTGAAEHVAFGLGRHFCVGSLLARYEVSESLGQLLDAMDDIHFMGGPPAEHGISMRGPKSMPLSFRPPT
ncbi:MAG: cytochrome P450 [Myxococcaceae bacterium]|nr:cytochrome P450 [Myxococcaceae bacterium]